jgi:hypothetical protein
MALRELAYRLTRFSVVQKDLPVRSDTRKVVSTRRVPNVLHELSVCFDCLLEERCIFISYDGTWGRDGSRFALPFRTCMEPLGILN